MPFGLVTDALAVSVILGMMISSMYQSSAFFNVTFVEALRDHAPTLEPLHLDRILELEAFHHVTDIRQMTYLLLNFPGLPATGGLDGFGTTAHPRSAVHRNASTCRGEW